VSRDLTRDSNLRHSELDSRLEPCDSRLDLCDSCYTVTDADQNIHIVKLVLDLRTNQRRYVISVDVVLLLNRDYVCMQLNNTMLC